MKFTSSQDKLDEIIEAILDISAFEILANIDSFNRNEDVLEFYEVEAHRNNDPYNVYLRGKSSNPEVDDDIWSIDWIITSIEKKKLTSNSSSDDRMLIDMYEEYNDILSDEESSDTDA